MDIYFRGAFGRRAATLVESLRAPSRLIDLDAADHQALSPEHFGRAVVLLSDASGAGLDDLATALRVAAVRWTSVHLYPGMLRVGPLVKAEGVCFECATRRYLASPGSPGQARLEVLLRSAGTGGSIEFTQVPETVVTMAVAEALRQLDDEHLPAGFIRKVDFIDFTMSAAIASPLHACGCNGHSVSERSQGGRFYLDLEEDMRTVIGAAG